MKKSRKNKKSDAKPISKTKQLRIQLNCKKKMHTREEEICIYGASTKDQKVRKRKAEICKYAAKAKES